MTNINELIASLKERAESIGGTIDEHHERMDDDFNPQDWYGGNFDDAFEGGRYLGGYEGEYHTIQQVIKQLEALNNDENSTHD